MPNASYPGRLTSDNAALLIVDHQVGLLTGVRDIEVSTPTHNVAGLAKAMIALKIPVVVTSTTEGLWGPLVPELQQALPGIERFERLTVNAWDDTRVVTAVEQPGRKSLIVTGVSADVCLAFPAMSALQDGYTTHAAIDASGAFLKEQAEHGIRRMVQSGVIHVCYSSVAVEILADNAAPEANDVYGALSMPFAGLVTGLDQYFSSQR